jgi:hypothetical protein
MSNHEILKIADQAGLTPVVEMFEDEVVKFAHLIEQVAIQRIKNKKNPAYSDIVSDGGMDPRI